MKNQVSTLLLTDDHDILLESISILLESEEGIKIIGKMKNGQQLVEKVKEVFPDLCVIDMDMPKMNGIQASEILLRIYPDIKILILSMYSEYSLIKKMVKLGVKGYLTKTCDKDELIFAIRQILKGKTYFPNHLLSQKRQIVGEDISNLEKKQSVTPREIEIIQLLCLGFNNKQIAKKLFLSPKTIDNHRSNIMRKLEVHNIVELVRFCLKNELTN